MRPLRSALVLVCTAAAACSTVLGFEDHEPFPPDAAASLGGSSGAASDAAPDVDADQSASDGPSDATNDAMEAGDVVVPPRVTQDLVVLYTFDEGSGTSIKDVSGVSPALDLKVETGFLTTWHPGFLEVKGATLIATDVPAAKVYDGCTASNEITIEAWLAPATTAQQGPARIVTLSPDTGTRNFTLGQLNDQYIVRLRTTNTDNNGEPPTLSLPGTLTTSLTHVVFTRASDGFTNIYINGSVQGTSKIDGDLSPWNASYRLGLANELTKDRVWLGAMHLVAVYSRALTAAEAAQNFAAGAD